MKLNVMILIAILALAVPALAGVSPNEVVLRIPYGNGAGELDTLMVDGDDPARTLVQCFTVEADETVWLLPRVEVAGRTVLFSYQNGAFSREVQFSGYPMGFLRSPEGIYSWTAGGNLSTAALIAFDPGPGRGEVVRAELAAGSTVSWGFEGLMRMVDGSPCLTGLGSGNHRFTLPLGTGLPTTRLSDAGAVRGVSVSGSQPVWQDTKLIMRGSEAILELRLQDEGLVAVLPDGGFVIRVRGEKREDGKFNPVFETYDAQGHFTRTVVTLPRKDKFEVGTFPWVFTPTHCYQLLLGDTEAQLVRY